MRLGLRVGNACVGISVTDDSDDLEEHIDLIMATAHPDGLIEKEELERLHAELGNELVRQYRQSTSSAAFDDDHEDDEWLLSDDHLASEDLDAPATLSATGDSAEHPHDLSFDEEGEGELEGEGAEDTDAEKGSGRVTLSVEEFIRLEAESKAILAQIDAEENGTDFGGQEKGQTQEEAKNTKKNISEVAMDEDGRWL